MSLFPAYIAPGEEQEKDRGHEIVQVPGEGFDCPRNLSIETFLQIICAGRRCCKADTNLADQHKFQRLPRDSEQDSAH